MALVLLDRVRETSTTSGTGTITLAGPVSSYQSFSAIGDGNTTYYTIVDVSTSAWEVGIGTYTASGTTLSRDTVLASSNANALVPFSSTAKDVFVTYPAERSVYRDSANAYTVQQAFNALTANTAGIGTATITAGTISTSPSAATDIVNKSYVDTIAAQGIVYHEPVYVESPITAGNLNAIYNQPGGPGVGVGATLTNNGTKAALVIDNVLMTTTKRVLIYNQTNAFENGVYTVTTVGTPDPGGTNWVLTRATDADTYAVNDPNALGQGDAFYVTAGDTGAGELYACNTIGTIIFGTTAITFAQISSTVPYFAGTGLNLSPATTFNISNTAVTAASYGTASAVGSFTVNAQGQLTFAVDTPILITSSQVSGLAASATTNTTDAANITSGTLPSNRLIGGYTSVTGIGTLTAGTWTADTIGVAYGGTGQTTYTDGQLLIGNTTGNTLAKATLTGTANQVIVTNGSGTITLSGPQNINTTASVQFGSFGVGTAASGTTGEIRATNNVTAFYSSDRRLKENIQDTPDALSKVCAIGSKTFDWTQEYIESKGGEDGYFIRKSDFGVIAQDVQSVFPQAVRTREDGTLAVDYEKLATLAFGAIKELTERIKTLENK